ncbi:MAG: GNAT family N-acetyltransferase [Candidatus Omnitrophica bacterium]|nr:GNAT family N-acetyltransferase [Candidatus Omnitrophota bacterium]MBI3021882.1 GNAT family N-acetyltransferase [Candidatus Omnitrophota bacterium]MBI3082942.1 GNAT family N-acetyltransferase [Candidatus Omnitrophota bacterium]
MIRPLQARDCAQVAAIHVAARPGDVLPDLGVSFLTSLYAALLHRPDVAAFVYEERGQAEGFVLGCLNASRVMPAVLRRAWLPLGLKTCLRCVSHPRLIPLALETLAYPRRSRYAGPELMAIAVDPSRQGRGIGTHLVAALSEWFRAQGCARYCVAVKAKNEPATRFYRRRGFRVIDQLRMYHEPWEVYECIMTPQAALPASAFPSPAHH